MMEPTPLVRFERVGKTFPNGTAALGDCVFAVERGEFVSLLGPSGCGKSTALRILAGLLTPSAGVVKWAEGANRREIGFVFQDATLMPWATVAANVALPLALAKADRARIRAAVGEALERVGLADFARAYPRELSGGMRMRVSIARALVTRPKLLLMDEPFAALDEITRFRLNNDLLALWHALGTTVVFVTHSVFESVYLSNRIIVMTNRPGRVFAELRVEASVRDERFRTSPEYAAHCRRALDALSGAMGEG